MSRRRLGVTGLACVLASVAMLGGAAATAFLTTSYGFFLADQICI